MLQAYPVLYVFNFIFLSSFIMTEASIMNDMNFFVTWAHKIEILCDAITSKNGKILTSQAT